MLYDKGIVVKIILIYIPIKKDYRLCQLIDCKSQAFWYFGKKTKFNYIAQFR
jgi:hypothetical protein